MKNRMILVAIVLVILAGLAILFVHQETEQRNEDAEAVHEVETLTIKPTERCTEGNLTVYAENDQVFEYGGEIEIKNSGWNGKPIEIIIHANEK